MNAFMRRVARGGVTRWTCLSDKGKCETGMFQEQGSEDSVVRLLVHSVHRRIKRDLD